MVRSYFGWVLGLAALTLVSCDGGIAGSSGTGTSEGTRRHAGPGDAGPVSMTAGSGGGVAGVGGGTGTGGNGGGASGTGGGTIGTGGGASGTGGGATGTDGGMGCSFPQGVPEADFTVHSDKDVNVGNAVNAVMEQLSGCTRYSSCYLGDRYTDQSWFVAVSQALRNTGLCAGQHGLGSTDEIAVSSTGCAGLWYGYHIFNYGGSLVVWSPGAARPSWTILAKWCL